MAAEAVRTRLGKGARTRRTLANYWYAWAMIAPVVVVITGIIGWPLVRGIFLSLTNANEANVERQIGVNKMEATYEFVGLENYADILTDSKFWDRLGWTMVWTVSCVAITFLIGLALANMLNRTFRGRTLYRMALILPWAIPAFVSVFAWRMIFNERNGILNNLLEGQGIAGIHWLSDPTWAKAAVIAVNVWLGVPFMLIAMLGALQSIPAEHYEAAEMDGAGPWQRFWNITLPGVRSVSMTVVLLSTIWTFNMFPVIFLLTRGGPAGSTDILVTEAFRLAFIRSPRDFANSAAWGVLILLLLVLFAISYRRALRKQGEVW
ncbi:sugar ABC transporter permease [Streptomyces carpaticus]|uniref:Arabinogalactan oligomer / maltooligosaccharide transport system permease protein n=1 Tax=Streptomyces harbinensis TaxID=1176198 RepID=A0A1I6RS70_9ACTN|nr:MULTISPECIES: sugar ABC transporter permease [Streptomyces]MCK1814091.1 sugar ABC transporter permease [Streptomyces sp. XM4011]QKV68470.1 sugar ABC transporter permease [Streptomyces harbinensis]UWM48790.1 sugar ABC transporter permease [Streptomyces carpaticus]SFS67545.1 arabinogalactan oligomer / maltooligosaccharide transport system permease protein [Streptomyces harbinensis]